jgi:hypothetical protein
MRSNGCRSVTARAVVVVSAMMGLPMLFGALLLVLLDTIALSSGGGTLAMRWAERRLLLSSLLCE